MARVFTTSIPDTDCIGDSLNDINLNYSNLDEECQRLDTRITSTSSSLITTAQTLSVLNPVDTTTVDLTWTASTRSLQADVKNSSISTTQIANNAITSQKLDSVGQGAGSPPIYGARAWVNFNGFGTNGTNLTIRGQGNVSSVLKNGTGDYTITFTTAMPDTNYCVIGTAAQGGPNASSSHVFSEKLNPQNVFEIKTTTQVRVQTVDNGGDNYFDSFSCNVVIFR